jgi:hypothetical protein
MEKVGKNAVLNYYFSQNLENGIILIEVLAFIDKYSAYLSCHRYVDVAQLIAQKTTV